MVLFDEINIPSKLLWYLLFTIKGNLKAAITADVIQGITMIIISFGVIAQGIYESGGVEKAYVINKEHGTYMNINNGDTFP